MEYAAYRSDVAPVEVQVALFQGGDGPVEGHLLIAPTGSADAATQTEWISRAYRDALARHELGTGAALFRRFFCSDLVNQAEILSAHPLASRTAPDEPCAVSWVEQPPAPPAQVSLWAYHVRDPAGSLEKLLDGAARPGDATLTWRRNGRAHCWTTGISGAANMPGVAAPRSTEPATNALAGGASAGDVVAQTRCAFEQYAALLRAHGLTLARDAVRTWVFVRDIDANYAGMVAARRAYFREIGLTPQTHFIASTGVAGTGPDPRARVTLDAYAIGGLQPGQVSYLAAPDHLGPTHAYGVTFERGTAIAYRDRTHLLISGTASIDPRGAVLYPHDVARQLERTLDNIDALLGPAGATFADAAALIAYVREPRDLKLVQDRIRVRCGGVPVAVVVAPICRSGWLVEVEAVGVLPGTKPDLPIF
ncbi:MAG: translation initiation inhibitor [Planctomycetota bacterium]